MIGDDIAWYLDTPQNVGSYCFQFDVLFHY